MAKAQMTKFKETYIKELYAKNLERAVNNLKKLEVFCGGEPHIPGLKGWVFEQTVHHCIKEELKARGKNLKIEEQFSFDGKAKKAGDIDLKVGKNIAIEIKKQGTRGDVDIETLQKLSKKARENDLRYVFLSLDENSKSKREKVIKVLEEENTFYLFFQKAPQDGVWEKFIKVLMTQR